MQKKAVAPAVVPPSKATGMATVTPPRKERKNVAAPPEKGAGPKEIPAAIPMIVKPKPAVEPPKTVSKEPEQHVDQDMVEGFIRKLKGTRPELLRTSTYYEGAKHVYCTLAGWPILSSIAPQVESVTESLINMTPLKPGPEEPEQKSVAALDKKISEALTFADDVVDTKKDETIEGLVSVKKTIHSFGPVQSAVGVAGNVGDGVGKAYGSAHDTVGGAWQQIWGTVTSTYSYTLSVAGNTANNVTGTAGNVVNHVTTTTGNAVNSAKGTAGNAANGVKSMISNTTASIGAGVNSAASTTLSLVHTVVTFPINVLQGIFGKKKPEHGPEG